MPGQAALAALLGFGFLVAKDRTVVVPIWSAVALAASIWVCSTVDVELFRLLASLALNVGEVFILAERAFLATLNRLSPQITSDPSGRRISPRSQSPSASCTASPAIGVSHDPSSVARKARSFAFTSVPLVRLVVMLPPDGLYKVKEASGVDRQIKSSSSESPVSRTACRPPPWRSRPGCRNRS